MTKRPESFWQRHKAAAVAAVVLLVGGCSGSGTPNNRDLPTDGPMEPAPPHGTLVRGDAGTRITDGLDLLRLTGTEPATILTVRSIGGDEHLRFLGAKIAGTERRLGAEAQLPGYPPTKRSLGPLVAAEGAEILPRDQTPGGIGFELLLGYEVVRDDEIAFRSRIEVTYRVGETEYLHSSPGQLVYCPEQNTADECFDHAERSGD